MSNVPLKDLKKSRFYVRSVYCSWKFFPDLNQNGCEIVLATVTPEFQGSRLLSWPRTKRFFICSAYGSSKTQQRLCDFSLLCTCVTHQVETTAATTAA